MIPPMTSQYLNVLKNSSFGAAIAYPELVSVFMGSALNNTGQAIEIIAITLAVYLVARPRRLGADELVQCPHGAGDAMSSSALIREKLFATPLDTVITLVIAFLLWRVCVPVIEWMLLDATFTGTTRADCVGAGACWVFVKARFGQFMYGLYPPTERWRVDLAGTILVAERRGAVVEGPALSPRARGRGIHRAAAARHLAACRRPRPAVRRKPPVGRADAHHLHLDLCRTDRDSARHPAGARAPVGAAGHPHAVGDLHRVLARRADRRGDLPCLDPASADHAGGRRRRSPGARRDRARPRHRGLHGGSGARRIAGRARRPARGRNRARPRLLARDRPSSCCRRPFASRFPR